MIQVKGAESFTDGMVFEYSTDTGGERVMTTQTVFIPRADPEFRVLLDRVDDCLEEVLERLLAILNNEKGA